MTQTKERITISIDKKIIKKYKDYCKKKGLKVSPQVELFIKSQLNSKK